MSSRYGDVDLGAVSSGPGVPIGGVGPGPAVGRASSAGRAPSAAGPPKPDGGSLNREEGSLNGGEGSLSGGEGSLSGGEDSLKREDGSPNGGDGSLNGGDGSLNREGGPLKPAGGSPGPDGDCPAAAPGEPNSAVSPGPGSGRPSSSPRSVRSQGGVHSSSLGELLSPASEAGLCGDGGLQPSWLEGCVREPSGCGGCDPSWLDGWSVQSSGGIFLVISDQSGGCGDPRHRQGPCHCRLGIHYVRGCPVTIRLVRLRFAVSWIRSLENVTSTVRSCDLDG